MKNGMFLQWQNIKVEKNSARVQIAQKLAKLFV